MDFYRAYAQPNLPEKYTFRVFALDVPREDNRQYSPALKFACIKNAGPQPPRPYHCPRCRLSNARFSTRVCYKAGIAGAWNMVCLSCQQVHVPNQRGPTDEALQEIEAIRARDHEAYLERKARKAKQRAKARAKPRDEDSDGETAVEAGTGKPFGIINNAVGLLGAGMSTAGGGRKKVKDAQMERLTVGRAPVNYHMKGLPTYTGKPEIAEEKPRTVELVFWGQDEDPRVEQVPVQFGHELFLYEFHYFKKKRGPCLYERYAFEASLWCDLPWSTSPVHVAPEDDVIFIRAMGVRCRGFGRQLDRYQRMHGLALRPAVGIRAKVNIPPARHHWLVIWGPHGGAPEVHLVDLSLADGLDDNARLALPWAHLLANAPFLLIWRESETRWAAVALGVSSGVWEAPITLVAHPAAEMLLGSGEAIAWLEEWRMRGGARSRATTTTNSQVRAAVPASRATRRLALPASSAKPYTSVHKTQCSVALFDQPASVEQGSLAADRAGNSSQSSSSSRTAETRKPEAELILNADKPGAPAHPKDRAAHRTEASSAPAVLDADKRPAARVALGDSKPGKTAHPKDRAAHKTEASSAPAVLDADERPASHVPLDDSKAGGPAHANPRPAHQSTIDVGKAGPTARHGKSSKAPVALGDSMAHCTQHATAHTERKGVTSAAPVELAVKQSNASSAPRQGNTRDLGEQSAAHAPEIASNLRPAARANSLSVQKAGPSARLVAAPLPVPQGSGAREQPITPSRRGLASHAAESSVPGHKRPASPSSGDEIEVVEGPPAAKDGPKPSKKSRLFEPSTNEVEVSGGPPRDDGSRVPASDNKPAAQMHTRDSRAPRDEDIVLITHPSAKLKRSFTNKARFSAASALTAKASTVESSTSTSSGARGQSHDSSDDEVEIVEDASIVGVSKGLSDDEVEIVENSSIIPKRRVSNVHGREFIDLT